MLVPVEMAGSYDDAADNLESVQDVTDAVGAAHPDLVLAQAGEASIDAGIWAQVGDDLGAAERLSLPITFAVLLLAFGALLAAGIPVLLAMSGVMATLGLYAPLSYLVPDGGSVANVVLLIGLAVGVDYSLFYLKRERDERRAGKGTIDAIEIAAATSGHSVVVSGVAVIVAMAGLFVVQDATFSALAVGAIVVVAVAVIGSLTVLPALLARLGRWVDRPRVPLLWRVNRRIGTGGISRRLLAPVLRHPAAALALSAVVIGAFAVPAMGMRMNENGLSGLPGTIPEVRTGLAIQNAFPAEGSTYLVAVQTSPGSCRRPRRRCTSWSATRPVPVGSRRCPAPSIGRRPTTVSRSSSLGRPHRSRAPTAGMLSRSCATTSRPRPSTRWQVRSGRSVEARRSRSTSRTTRPASCHG